MEADGECEDFNEVTKEELSGSSRHLGVNKDVFTNFRKHGEVPLKLPAGVHDQDDSEVQPLPEEDEEAHDRSDSVQQGVEPFLSGLPVREPFPVSMAVLNYYFLNIFLFVVFWG